MKHEIYIFGSTVRGEVSRTSDIDVLIIPTEGSRDDYPESWSVYSADTIEAYFRTGRLFAWHLYLEAQRVFPVVGTPFLAQIGPPASYTSAQTDLIELEYMLNQALEEIRSSTNSLIYELGIVYTAIRDIAMAASWAILGKHNFSQYAPYQLPLACPLPIDTYRGAMLARHRSTRGTTHTIDPESIAKQLLASPIPEWANRIRSYK